MNLSARLREVVARRARAVPILTSLWAQYRRRKYRNHIERFEREGTGDAGKLPIGVVYEATMRCNLTCEFRLGGDLLQPEGEWGREVSN